MSGNIRFSSSKKSIPQKKLPFLGSFSMSRTSVGRGNQKFMRRNSIEACNFAALVFNEPGELEWWRLWPEGLVALEPNHLSGLAD